LLYYGEQNGTIQKKPVVIEAVQFTGSNIQEMDDFIDVNFQVNLSTGKPTLIIPTLEGDHEAKKGDFIIKGIAGEFYPCKPDIFEQTYEEID